MKNKSSEPNELLKNGYTGIAQSFLQQNAIQVGDRVSLSLGTEKIEGVIIPRNN
jgi:hypothetical protein